MKPKTTPDNPRGSFWKSEAERELWYTNMRAAEKAEAARPVDPVKSERVAGAKALTERFGRLNRLHQVRRLVKGEGI